MPVFLAPLTSSLRVEESGNISCNCMPPLLLAFSATAAYILVCATSWAGNVLIRTTQ